MTASSTTVSAVTVLLAPVSVVLVRLPGGDVMFTVVGVVLFAVVGVPLLGFVSSVFTVAAGVFCPESTGTTGVVLPVAA